MIYVWHVRKKPTLSKCRLEHRPFPNVKYSRFAVEFTFQQSNSPSGSVAEEKRYSSDTYKLHGHKVEVSVIPSGLAIGFTEQYPGFMSDLDIFAKTGHFMHGYLKKECELSDTQMKDY